MKKVLVIQPLRPEALRLFEERGDIQVEMLAEPRPETLMSSIRDADALTIRDASLPVHVLEAASRLKVISRHGVGYDNIPIDYCTGRGIPVTVVGDANVISVAEHTMYLMLAAARASVQADEAVRCGDFGARSRLVGVELYRRQLLIIGFGRIGKEVAARASAFGMKIVVFDPYADRKNNSETKFVEGLEEALHLADVLSVHVPLSSKTRGLIGSQELEALPKGAIVINTARGGVIDEEALLEAIRNGQVRAAGLDTFSVEPLPLGHPLTLEKRIVLSPHAAALTEESLLRMGLATARNALAGLDGTLDPERVVNRAALDKVSDASK